MPIQKFIRINGQIRVPEVRLIDAAGQQVGVVQTRRAVQMAQEAGLDLVEVAPTARPPVCKILDYGKFKYEIKKKAQQAKKKQAVIQLKEVKLRPSTDEHDYQFKMRHVRRFLEEGHKAKVTVVFRGREMAYTERGRTMMRRVLETLKDVAKVENQPRMEGRALVMVVAPQ